MKRITAYSHTSARGTFWVIMGLDTRWHAIWDGEDLGGYDSPEEAVIDLACGKTRQPSCGNTARLGLSADVGRWFPHRAWTRPGLPGSQPAPGLAGGGGGSAGHAAAAPAAQLPAAPLAPE